MDCTSPLDERALTLDRPYYDNSRIQADLSLNYF